MPLANVLDRPECANELAASSLLRDGEQLGRGAARRGYDNDWRAMHAARNDVGSAADRIRVSDRRAAELDDYHVFAT